jgi:hypothetical protein
MTPAMVEKLLSSSRRIMQLCCGLLLLAHVRAAVDVFDWQYQLLPQLCEQAAAVTAGQTQSLPPGHL